MKRRLAVVTERAMASVKALQIKTAQDYEVRLRLDLTPTTCTKACTSCCSHPFLISIAEGVLLYRSLQASHKWTHILRRKLIETRNMVLGIAFDAWLLSNIECPLLEASGLCSAYEARPLRCRVTYSTGNPALCRPNALGARTPLVANADVVIEFARKSLEALKLAGVNDSSLMPLAEALLLGEAVDTGKLDVKDVELQYFKDLVNG